MTSNTPHRSPNAILKYLPARVTLRGDWENRQLYVDDEYLNPQIATSAFPSLTHLLPAQTWALMVLMHFAPVHIVAEAIENIAILNAIGAQFKKEDFEEKVKLRYVVENARQNATDYAY